ncbi:MAG: thiosulfate oxidation carrier complex protein SoxZ [Burkholderiales bacterium]|nr:thiosulfate oxidation carrier complex protein SoxZ [Burkholderiales bacterium]
MNAQRRDVLQRMGKTAALAAGLVAGVLRPTEVLAAWNHRAFDAKRLSDALDALGVERPAATRDILIQAPETVDSGAFVPIEIVSTIAGTETLALFVDRNPWPYIARFDVSRGALAYASIRVRVGESSPVRVVANAGGRQYVAVKQVNVTVGGCGDASGGDASAALDGSQAPQPIRIRAIAAGEVASVRVLMTHPMENGLRKSGSGQPIPEHFIRSVSARLNGRTVLEAEFGRSVSANPLIGFKVKGAKAGDRLVLRWEDSKGLARTDEASVSAS